MEVTINVFVWIAEFIFAKPFCLVANCRSFNALLNICIYWQGRFANFQVLCVVLKIVAITSLHIRTQYIFSQLFKHINWNIRPNVHNLKFVYQLPNQFCWTPSTFSALDSDAHSKAHIFHSTTHNSIYLANSSWIPSIPPLGVHTEHTDNNISKLQRLLCNEQSAICYRRVTEESHDTR